MRTDDLVAMLARSAGPAPRAVAARRLGPAALVGLLAAALAAILLVGPLPADALMSQPTWTKLAYTGLLAAGAGWLAARHARPAMPTRGPWLLLALVVAGMAAHATAGLLDAPAGTRLPQLLGQSWMQCPWAVLALSTPGLAASLWALRRLAPTHARLAGLSAGLLAGSLGALGYALACPEASAAFVAAWYSLGILLTGALGALLGPRVLRW
jgi:hypothetical protein